MSDDRTAEQDVPEPSDLLAEVTDAYGIVWTRYHTDVTGKGRHW